MGAKQPQARSCRAPLLSAVSLAASTIYMYWWAMPCLLYCVFWWHKLRSDYSFVDLLSLYGYSVAVFVPISVSGASPRFDAAASIRFSAAAVCARVR